MVDKACENGEEKRRGNSQKETLERKRVAYKIWFIKTVI